VSEGKKRRRNLDSCSHLKLFPGRISIRIGVSIDKDQDINPYPEDIVQPSWIRSLYAQDHTQTVKIVKNVFVLRYLAQTFYCFL
jgi:hypothetical protein